MVSHGADMEAHIEDNDVNLGVINDHSEAMECHTGVMDAHPRDA